MNLPDYFRAPLAWGMIIIVVSMLGWGLISLIRISEHASPDTGVNTGTVRLPVSSVSEKRVTHVAKKTPVTAQRKFVVKVRSEPAGEAVKPVTYHVAHRIVRSDGSRASSGAHEFRGGKRVYFESLEDYAIKDRIRAFKSGWIRLYLTKPVKLSHIIIHRASVGKRSFRNGKIKLEVQDSRGHWQTLLLLKDRAIDRPLNINRPKAALADVNGVRFRFKTSEPITIGPIDLLP